MCCLLHSIVIILLIITITSTITVTMFITTVIITIRSIRILLIILIILSIRMIILRARLMLLIPLLLLTVICPHGYDYCFVSAGGYNHCYDDDHQPELDATVSGAASDHCQLEGPPNVS